MTPSGSVVYAPWAGPGPPPGWPPPQAGRQVHQYYLSSSLVYQKTCQKILPPSSLTTLYLELGAKAIRAQIYIIKEFLTHFYFRAIFKCLKIYPY